MATSGSFTSYFGTSSKYELRMAWKRNSVDIANNKSNVTVTISLWSPSGYNISSSVTKSGTLTINGSSTSVSFNCALAGNQLKQIATKTVDIAHNSDGTKSFSMSFKGTIGITFSSGKVNDISVSGTGTLDTIPRASSFTLSTTSATLGSTTVTVNISRASSSFTHNVYVKFGNSTNTAHSSAGTSCYWVPPIGLASEIPNATSGTATVYVDTYNGSTKIGSASKTMTYTVPATVKPVISSLGAAAVASGAATSYGYVQGKSKCQLTINGATGSYGSTIKSYKITGNGGTWTTSSATTGVLNSTGSITFSATITDSRGRTSDTKSVTITVQAYSNPNITGFSVARTNSGGTASDTGTYAKVTAQYTFTSLSSKNAVTSKVEYAVAGSTSWTNAGSVSSGSSVIIGGGGLSTANNYQIRLTVSDNFTSTSKILTIAPQFVTLDFKSGGKGIAIGKASVNDGFEIQMATKFFTNLLSGSNNAYDLGNTTYRWRTLYAVNAINTSDVNYKENVKPIIEDSGKIMSLGVEENIDNEITLNDMRDFIKNDCDLFKYNYKKQNHEEIGFIAQNIVNTKVGRTLIIGEENADGGYCYSQGTYVGIVVGALKEEIKIRDIELEEQKQINEELNNKVDELEERLAKLEKLLDNE